MGVGVLGCDFVVGAGMAAASSFIVCWLDLVLRSGRHGWCGYSELNDIFITREMVPRAFYITRSVG
jgi:hypothetical protein